MSETVHKEDLIFLNAFNQATQHANFKQLNNLGIETTPEFKKEVYGSYNAAIRCFQNNNQGVQVELTDDIDPNESNTISELVDYAKKRKRVLKDKNISIADERANSKPEPVKPPTPEPIKSYSPAELAKFQEEYFKKGKK